MTLQARAAALRGDDYQHVVGLYQVCRMLVDEGIESVSIEDAAGGAFDDVVVRMRTTTGRPHEYIQVKSSNHRNAVVNEEWLLKATTPTGKSPLQRFYNTWRDLVRRGEPFTLTLLTNRNYDHDDPVLGLIDNAADKIARISLDRVGPRTDTGKALQRWADSVGIDLDKLKDFLTDVSFVHGESERSWEDRCRPLMRNAGLRDDDHAVAVGRVMVRGWVTAGRGPQTRNDVRAQVTEKDLLARSGTLVLAVHAIDRARLPELPNVTVDVVDLYPDIDPFQRRQLIDSTGWQAVVLPKLVGAKAELGEFRSRRVHVVGHMRLPMYFAVGRTLPDVAGWVLSVDQRGVHWSTDAKREAATVVALVDEQIAEEGDLAVAIALTQDPTDEVMSYLGGSEVPIRRVLVLSTVGGPSQAAVTGSGSAAAWASQARERIRAAVRDAGATKVHLFMAAPAGSALFLGHQWNMVPTTTVYEHQMPGYVPTMTFPG